MARGASGEDPATGTARGQCQRPYDLSGSAHWVQQSGQHNHGAPRSGRGQDVEIHVQKVRFKNLGRVGLAMLKYDRVVGRYFEMKHFVDGELYADPERR